MYYYMKYFTENDLKRMNKERRPETYGFITTVSSSGRKYRIDVSYSTKEAYGYEGIQLELYETNDDYNHVTWITSVRKIVTSNDHYRFARRFSKVMDEEIAKYEYEIMNPIYTDKTLCEETKETEIRSNYDLCFSVHVGNDGNVYITGEGDSQDVLATFSKDAWHLFGHKIVNQYLDFGKGRL